MWQLFSADCMALVSSPPLGLNVAQMVVRLGMPPTELSPGFHTVVA